MLVPLLHLLMIAAGDGPHFTRLHSAAPAVDGGLSRGVAWGDLDQDGWEDLVVANTIAQPEALYMNRMGRFSQVHEIHLTMAGGFDEGVQWIDFDNDGDLDLFVADSREPGRLYRNIGAGALEPVHRSGLDEAGGASEGCWADFDGDGMLDVFVARRGGADSRLFRNTGSGRFEPVAGPWSGRGGDARACAWGDADGDGDPDLYVANFIDQRGTEPAKYPNDLYLNRGEAGFSSLSDIPPVTLVGLSYGISWVDFDADGDLDLFVTNISATDRNWLFENRGELAFVLRDDLAVVNDSRGPSKGHVWGDFDNDGDLDLFVANGTENTEAVEAYDVGNFLYLRESGGFRRAEAGPLTADRDVSAGAAAADYDHDWDLDLYVANWGGSDEDNALYRNDTAGGRWLMLGLVGTRSNRDAIGARVTVEAAGRLQHRFHLPRQGYGSQNTARVHFGLGRAERVERLEIHWPSGRIDRHGPLAANRMFRAVEGGEIRPATPILEP